jgi:hypothetical protein
MREYNLKLKPKKCELFQLEGEFLGKLVNAEGISIAKFSLVCIYVG